MSMSIGVVGILVDDNSNGACGGQQSMDEEACDTCGGEVEGG